MRGRVLDLGCGAALIYQGKNVDLTGVDISAVALAEARTNYPLGVFFQVDALSTGLPAHAYDTVLLLGLLDYFEKWDEILLEAERLVKPNGQILATLLNGFVGHDWSRYPRLTGSWHLLNYKGNIFD